MPGPAGPVDLSAEASASTPAAYVTHPLAAPVAAADLVMDWMSFRLQELSEAGWTRCDQALTDPDFFPRWRVAVADWLGGEHSDVPERTTAGYVLQWYLGISTYLSAALFHSVRRVPALQPQQLAFRLDGGRVTEVALRPGRFWCLPGDPEAGHPDALAVADDPALAAELRREVIAHAEAFLRVYEPQVRFGPRTLWAAVTDALDTSLLLAGRAFGSVQAGAADAQLVLGRRIEPLTSPSTICTVTDRRGRTHWTRRRSSCCFYYALPGEQPCATCPRVDDDERARILSTLE